MIPGLALMFAMYATARLLNDCLARDPRDGARTAMWVFSLGTMVALWLLALLIVASGASIG